MMRDDLSNDESLLMAEQIEYYRARAPEYDEWFYRRGLYDRGPALNTAWQREITQVQDALDELVPTGKVLELACGTGLWSERLVRTASELTCVDASSEMIALNRRRVCRPDVRYVTADIFSWRPPERYDFLFFGFWLSHVPENLFQPFWSIVKRCVSPGGRVFFVDSCFHPAARGSHEVTDARTASRSRRRISDGREFDVVKVFYLPQELQRRVSKLGWRGRIRATEQFFLYGSLELADS